MANQKNDRFTIFSKRIIKGLGIVLFALSAISILYVFIDAKSYSFDLSESDSFLNFIGFFAKYQNLYSSTFVVLAAYYALNQYIESRKSNKTAIEQLQTQIQEINNRFEKEKIELTMVQCKYFYDEIQFTIKEMYSTIEGTLKIDHISWNVNDFTEEDLFDQDSGWYKQFDSIPNNIRDKIILSLSKLEMFSIYFMHGNADIEIGFNTVGKDFCKQVKAVYPLISIWRSRARLYEENFYNKTTELYTEWNNKLEEIRKNWPQQFV